MHYHLLAGYDPINITHEATYEDLDKSIEDFVGLVDTMFSDTVETHPDRFEETKKNMRQLAADESARVIYAGEPGSMKLFWLPCTRAKDEEGYRIPCRN